MITDQQFLFYSRQTRWLDKLTLDGSVLVNLTIHPPQLPTPGYTHPPSLAPSESAATSVGVALVVAVCSSRVVSRVVVGTDYCDNSTNISIAAAQLS